MPKMLQKLFSAPTFEDTNLTRKARMLHSVLWAALAMIAIATLAVFFIVPEPQVALASLTGLSLAVVLSLLLMRGGAIRAAGRLLTISLATALLAATYFAGGVTNIAYTSFVMVILAGGLLLGKRYAPLLAGAGSVIGLGILWLERSGALPEVGIPAGPEIHWVAGTVIFVWAAVAIFTALQELEHALSRAHMELEERSGSEDTLRRQVLELYILNQVVAAGAQSQDEDTLIEKVTCIIGDLLFPDNFGIIVLDEASGNLLMHPSYRIDPNYRTFTTQLDSGIVGKVIVTGKARRVNDTSQDPDYVEGIPGIHSELCVPIMIDERITGVINVESQELGAFSQEDENLLVTVAGQLATAIERLRLDSALDRSEVRYRRLFDEVPTGLFTISTAGWVIDANPALVRILGYPSKESLLSANFRRNFIFSADLMRFLRKIKQNGLVNGFEAQVRRYDGSLIWIEGNATVVKDHSGQMCAIEGSMQDISGRVRAQSQLRHYARHLEVLRDIGKTALTAQSQEAIACITLEQVQKLVPCQFTSMILLDDEKGQAQVYNGNHSTPARSNGRFKLSAQDLKAIPVPEEGSPYYNPDLMNGYPKTALIEKLSPQGIRSIIVVPLLARGELIGTLNLGAEQASAFNQEQIQTAGELANWLSVALQNANLLHESQQQAQELSGLYETALTISTELETEALLQLLYRQVERILHPDAFMVALLEEDTLRLPMVIEDGNRLTDWEKNSHKLDSSGLTGWVIRNRKAFLAGDLSRDPLPEQPKHAVRPARAWLGVPLIYRERTLGAISVQSFQPNVFDNTSQRFLESLSAQVAIALENARLFENERRRTQELAAMLNMSSALRESHSRRETLSTILEKITRDFSAQAAAVLLYDRGEQKSVAELGCGDWSHWTGQIIDSLEITGGTVSNCSSSYINNDTTADPPAAIKGLIGDVQAIACVPLISQVESIGYLCLGCASEISNEQVRLLSAVADIATGAIQRATLHQQTDRRLKNLQALHRIDQAITGSVDLKLVLQILLEQVTSQLKVDAATVLLLDQRSQILHTHARRGFHTGALRHTSLHLGESYAGYAAMERRILHISDLSENLGSFNQANLLPQEGFITYFAVPLVAKGEVKGVLELFNRNPFYADQEWHELLETLASQAAIAIENASLFQELQRSNQDLALAYDTTLEGWARALELRDQETEGHSRRVTRITINLAKAMGIPESELGHVRRGALLHDIGKMGIPDSILLKTGPLSNTEWLIMKQHPVYAYELLKPIRFLRQALEIPYCHHEHWNGNGYPRGLKGEQIPLSARVFAVVDVFDALTSDRPYRPAWSEERALQYLLEKAGEQFDPAVVQAFFTVLQQEKQLTQQK